MNRLPKLLYWSIFMLLLFLYGRGNNISVAQSVECGTGTIATGCTYMPIITGADVVGVEETPIATSDPTHTFSPTATAIETGTATSVLTATAMPTVTESASTVYDAIPVDGPPTDRLPHLHGDLNLSLRSYRSTEAILSLIDVNGDADSNAPQLTGLFAEPRLTMFVAAFQVHDWDWSCGENGCRGEPLTTPSVTMIEMATDEGEAIHIPSRETEIYSGGYKAMVLYAESERITLTYLREDTIAFGYAVHIENIAIDPALLSLYQTLNDAGRSELPALRNGERFGNAIGTSIKVAIRDRGTFMDPRVRKDWWQGYRR